MSFFSTRQRAFHSSFALGSALAALALTPLGCVQGGGTGGESTESDEVVGAASQPFKPIGPAPVKCPPEPACSKVSPKAYRLSPSLVLTRNTESIAGVTDDAILDTHFPLEDVLDQLLSQAGMAGTESADELLQRLWDTQNASSGVFNEGYQPHCSDNGSTINGLPVDCPRPEGQLASNATTTDFRPVAVFNRFDLAPEDGSHCGEYRIIYAMENVTSGGVFGRNFIIFEGQLPNPTPQCGVETCRPVVDFWSSLSSMTNQGSIGNALRKFYFDGLPGFAPVIQLQNYGFGASGGGYGNSGGQIRTNQFVDFQLWQLREHQLDIGCDDDGCRLVTVPVTVKNNPFFDFFADPSASIDPSRASAFQSSFVANVGGQSQVSRLAVSHPNVITNLNLIAMDIDNKSNAGQSTSQGNSEAYLPPFQSVPTSAFHGGIQGELTSGGFALSPDEIVARSETQSCKGCHQLSPNDPTNIGGGLTWPNSLGFVHVDEGGDQSQALRCVFEPHRQAVGLGFLANCGADPAPIQSNDPDCGAFQSKGGGYSGAQKAAADPELVEEAKAAGAPSPVKTLGGGSKVN